MIRYISDLSEDKNINKLSWFGEVFFRRLWNVVDDYGRFSANPLDLKNRLFPVRDVRIADIIRCLNECESADLLVCLEADNNERFLELKNFTGCTRIYKSKSAYSSSVYKCLRKENKNDKENEEKERSKEKEDKETERTKESKENSKKESFSIVAERIWKVYPKKDGKKKGIEAIINALKRGLTEEFLTERVELYKQSRNVKQGFTMMAQGWFNQERYFDESLNQIKPKSSNYDEGFFNISSLNRKLWGKEQVNDNGQ